MDDITALKAEIERLRSLCEDHDIDPDYVPEGLVFDGRPIAEITRVAVRLWQNRNAFLKHLDAVEPGTKIGTCLRIDTTTQTGPDYLGAARDVSNT
jgi:hypothetical protein